MTRRIPIVTTFVVVAAAAVMVMLGFWQLGRVEQKEAMIAQFERNADDARVMDMTRLYPDSLESRVYRQVRMDCAGAEGWNAVAGRNANGRTGYVHRYICKPAVEFGCGLEERGRCPALLAEIGWSPDPGDPRFTSGVVTGTLVASGDDFKVVSDEGLAGLEAVARPDPNDLPNNHLAYAWQWFFFALTALAIYWLALRRKWREQD